MHKKKMFHHQQYSSLVRFQGVAATATIHAIQRGGESMPDPREKWNPDLQAPCPRASGRARGRYSTSNRGTRPQGFVCPDTFAVAFCSSLNQPPGAGGWPMLTAASYRSTFLQLLVNTRQFYDVRCFWRNIRRAGRNSTDHLQRKHPDIRAANHDRQQFGHTSSFHRFVSRIRRSSAFEAGRCCVKDTSRGFAL